MQLIKKITIKTCGGFSVARIKEVMTAANLSEGQGVPLLKIAGEANGAKTGQTDKGDYVKFKGQFVGTDMTTGELYSAGECILPHYLGSQLAIALTEGESVRFAFEIGAQRADTAITGYAFTVKPLMEIKLSDSVAELMALAGIKESPKLAAPVPAAEAAPTPEAALAGAPHAEAPKQKRK